MLQNRLGIKNKQKKVIFPLLEKSLQFENGNYVQYIIYSQDFGHLSIKL